MSYAELTKVNDMNGGPPEQRLSRSAARAGTAAGRFQVSLSPALGPARRLCAITEKKVRRGFKRRSYFHFSRRARAQLRSHPKDERGSVREIGLRT